MMDSDMLSDCEDILFLLHIFMLTTGRHLHYETHEHLEQNNSYALCFLVQMTVVLNMLFISRCRNMDF